MYTFFKNKSNNKFFVYFLVLTFLNSGYFAYSHELVKNYINVKLRGQNKLVGGTSIFMNPSGYSSEINKEIRANNIKKTKPINTKVIISSLSYIEYKSDIKVGNIGISKKGNFDPVYDNIFKVNINQDDFNKLSYIFSFCII